MLVYLFNLKVKVTLCQSAPRLQASMSLVTFKGFSFGVQEHVFMLCMPDTWH